MEASGLLLNCGHAPTPPPWGVGTGYGYLMGYSMCYRCIDADHMESLRWESRSFVYTFGRGGGYPTQVITWTGGHLGRIEHAKKSRDDRMIIAWVRDVHGQRWIGRGSAHNGTYLKMIKLKGK